MANKKHKTLELGKNGDDGTIQLDITPNSLSKKGAQILWMEVQEGSGHHQSRTIVDIRPKDARRLARQLLKFADRTEHR